VRCVKPMTAWRIAGEAKVVIAEYQPRGDVVSRLELRCGQCIACRLEKSRQWAVRCMHEASQWDNNVFVTLTYDDEHLPEDQGLDVSEFQRFAKRLRKARPDDKVRYFHCGEYGEQLQRPHYHALVFNVDFPDR